MSTIFHPRPIEATLDEEMFSLLEECGASLLQYATGIAGSVDAARDAVQEASLRYWVARRTGATFDNPRAWLFRVARHYIFDQMRKQSRHHMVSENELTQIADTKGDPDQAYQQVVLADTIRRALSPRERTCIRHRLDGLSYEDIGRSMGISPNTVGVMINRAFKKVQAA